MDGSGEEEPESWTDMADHNSKRIGKSGMVPRGRVLKTSNRPPYPCNLPPGACSSAQTCCGSSCVVVSTNPSHCGRCGHMCSKKRECCNGKCRRLATDEKNCGRCGTRCPRESNACLASVDTRHRQIESSYQLSSYSSCCCMIDRGLYHDIQLTC